MSAEITPDPRTPENTAPELKAARLAELETRWNQEFTQAPKLPSAALLTGAVAMALGFGFVLFLASATVRRYAWIWLVLGVAMGLLNRFLARRWYKSVVIPWDAERRATAAELQRLRE